MSVPEREFSGDLHDVEEGTGYLPTLRAQNTSDNGGKPIHKLGQGDQWEQGRDELDYL